MIKNWILFLCFFVMSSLVGQVTISSGDIYSYQKGSETVPSDWKGQSADITSWNQGLTPFWYGDGKSGTGTEIIDMQNSYTTLYLRRNFEAMSIHQIEKLKFAFDYDDGFIIYINGEEVVARNAPSYPSNNSTAPVNHESGTVEYATVSVDDCFLNEGTNTLAIHVFNISLTSSDFVFDLEISTQMVVPQLPALPDTLGVEMSHKASFYQEAFPLTLSSKYGMGSIKYTLDGSDPGTSSTAIVSAKDSVIVSIDPTSSVGRPITPAVVVRACVVKDGFAPSEVTTQTYVFVNEVSEQLDAPGAPWPTYDVNGQELYFGVSDDITKSTAYADKMSDGLLSISTLSIVTDAGNLFDSGEGIYVNAMEDGIDWERPCSFELIHPDGRQGFSVPAGLRIRGGWSRHSYYAKHSFRLFFRSEYGDGKLDYPLFEDEGVDEFDKIDLRSAQNYAWYRGDKGNTFLREVFCRDLQREMGQPYTRSRYYHLYINGLYWGLYMTQERAESNYAASYFGGSEDDYDVIKASRNDDGLVVEANEGTTDTWKEIWNAISGSIDDATYFNLIGCNEQGDRDLTIPVLVDIDNLIDFMINIFYTGNFDCPVSAFGGNSDPNNFFSIHKHDNPFEGFKFFEHDGEHALFSYAVSPGVGLYENRVNIATRSYNKMDVTSFTKFHPQWLHARLCNHEEYRQRFADRAYVAFGAGGVCSPEYCTALFNSRRVMIEEAIIPHSARWGGYNSSPALNKDEHWIPEVNKVLNDYFPYRTDIVKDQLLSADLFPSLEAPIFVVDDVLVTGANYSCEISADINLTAAKGQLVYTTGGQDPRLIGGGIYTGATTNSNTASFVIDKATCIKVRAYDGTSWSSCKSLFITPQVADLSHLKVTELNYHPLDNIQGDDTITDSKYEFIEFKNVSATEPLNIGGLKFDQGITYEFPDNYILSPHHFFVLASDAYDFYTRYNRLPSGEYKKQLSNSGEHIILLKENDSLLMDIYYEDEGMWAAEADGLGKSLVSFNANPSEDTPDASTYWWYSQNDNGSPFSDDAASEGAVLSNDESFVDVNDRLSVFPNPTRGNVFVDICGLDKGIELAVTIYDVNGNMLLNTSYDNGDRLSLTSYGLHNGIYLIKVQSDKRVYNSKIIIY